MTYARVSVVSTECFITMITVVGSPGPLFILGVCLVKENFWHLTNNVLMNATIAYVTA